MSIWSSSQNRNISNIIFKREFKECSHVHSVSEPPSTDIVSNVGTNGLIHINGTLIALIVIHKSGGDGLHTPFILLWKPTQSSEWSA